jgi:hypothetical protein
MTAILLGLWATLLLSRGTPIGRWLEATLVVTPARRLSKVSPGQWLVLAALLVSVGAILWFLEEEGRLLLGMAGPEIVGFLSAAEVTAYADILVATLVALSAGAPRGVAAQVRHRIARARGRTTRRHPHVRADKRPSNDDEPGGAFRLAA